MKHLAGASLGPAIGMMGGMADLTAAHAARVARPDLVEAVGAAFLSQPADSHAQPPARPGRGRKREPALGEGAAAPPPLWRRSTRGS